MANYSFYSQFDNQTNRPSNKQPQIALFIDAENVPAQHMDDVMATLQQQGEIVIKRIYANWSKPQVQGWRDAIVLHGLTSIHQFDHVVGKNASDISICIDAIETCFKKKIDIFCVVTSDSDFTPLCLRLREYGKQVIGMGNMNSSKSLVNACNSFKYFVKENQSLPAPIAKNPVNLHNKKSPNPNESKKLIAFIKELIASKGKDGVLNTATLGSALRNHPTLDMSTFGYSKIGDLLKVMHDFDTFTENSALYVKVHGEQPKAQPQNQAKPQPKAQTQTIPEPPPTYQSSMLQDKISSDMMLKDTALTNALSNAIATYQKDNFAKVSDVNSYLYATFGIRCENYGYNDMVELLKNLTTFEVKKQKDPKTQQSVYYVADKRFLTDNDTANAEPQTSTPNTPSKATCQELRDNNHLVENIRQAMEKHEQNNNGWVMLAHIGQALRENGVSHKEFGFKTLAELLKTMDLFDIEQKNSSTYVKDPYFKPKKSVKTEETTTTQTLDIEPVANKGVEITEIENAEIATAQNDVVEMIETSESLNVVAESSETVAEVTAETTADEMAEETAETTPTSTTDELIKLLSDSQNDENFVNDANDDSDRDEEEISLGEAIDIAIESTAQSDGWTSYSDIGKFLYKEFGVRCSDYGCKNFIEFVKQYADFNDTDIEEQKVNSKLCLKLSDYTNPILYSS